MTKHTIENVLISSAMVGLLWMVAARPAQAQFLQNRETKIDTSSYPGEIKKKYRVFVARCGECHSLDTSYRPSTAPLEMQVKAWKAITQQMQAKASSHITEQDVQRILAFLDYDASHRKPQPETAQMPMPGMNEVMMGRQLFAMQSCDNCHTIAGKGGSIGPDLTDAGSRLSRDQMAKVLHGVNPGASGLMPPLPPETSEQQLNALIDYLQTLKK